jgi:hypothetical protein
MLRRILASLLPLVQLIAPLAAAAQEPVKVPFACAEDELQAAGLLCTEEEPCAIYLELSAIAPAGKKIFVAGNLHANSGTLDSILLSSDDGGLTWKEPAPRVRAAAIEQLEIYDLEHGWAAGEIQYPLPADPFFLVTSDGGQTWRQRPVSDDGGPGAIQRFWFDSAQHGELIVDAGKSSPGGRYVTWESETGGGSWMVRGATDKLPALKHVPPSVEPDFRIRAAGEKSYLIEVRKGEKWETLATFPIEIASCSIKPPEPKEPPPETEQPAPKEKDYVEELKLGQPAKTTATPATPPKKGPGW